jgi:hypothetical protein
MPTKSTCKESLTVPNPDTTARSRRSDSCTRAPQHSGRRFAIIVCALVIVAIGIGGVACKPKSGDQTERTESRDGSATANPAKDITAERDRDYLMVLETLYELDGVANGKKFWLKVDGQPGFNDLRGAEAAMVMARAFDPALKAAEFASVEQRKMFVDWHKMDSKEWRPEFVKRYPERVLINDEIAVVIRDLCSQHLTDISMHLIDQKGKIGKELFKKADSDPELNARMARNGPKIIDDHWHEYRMKYLEQRGPKLVEEVRSAVKKMDSIVRLKAKVEAVAPPRWKR